jgi:hypothetical protein
VNYIIVGTDHDLQKSTCADTGLKDLLRAIIRTRPVVLIAEEVKTSEDVYTFGRELIGDDKWLSIDMTTQERKDAGVYDVLRSGVGPVQDPVTGNFVRASPYHMKSEGKRETFWLDKIDRWCQAHGVSDGTVVVTCGHNHLDYLAEKIVAREHTVAKREYLPYDKEAIHGIFTIFDD